MRIETVDRKLTIQSEIVVEYLEQRKAVPSVGRLFGKDFVHVVGKERPEDLGMLHQEVAKPRERLRCSVVGA